MEEAIGVVVGVVVVVGLVVAGAMLLGSGDALDDYGSDHLRMDSHKPLRSSSGGAGGGMGGDDHDDASEDREAEIRSMLEARNVYRRRRGEEPLDVDAEYARLSKPAVDPGVEEEVRTMVLARNERRKRRGESPLDVDAEVRRMLDDIGA